MGLVLNLGALICERKLIAGIVLQFWLTQRWSVARIREQTLRWEEVLEVPDSLFMTKTPSLDKIKGRTMKILHNRIVSISEFFFENFYHLIWIKLYRNRIPVICNEKIEINALNITNIFLCYITFYFLQNRQLFLLNR